MQVELRWSENPYDRKIRTAIKLSEVPTHHLGLASLARNIDWHSERLVNPDIRFYKDLTMFDLRLEPAYWVTLNAYISTTDADWETVRRAFMEMRQVEYEIYKSAPDLVARWNEACVEAAHLRA